MIFLTVSNGSTTNGSNGSSKDIDSDPSSSPKPQNGGSEDLTKENQNNETKENSTKENSQQQNGGSKIENNLDIVNNSNHQTQQNMPTFQPDPNKSAFMTPNKNNEADFMLQQQPLYDQQHDMKFGEPTLNFRA